MSLEWITNLRLYLYTLHLWAVFAQMDGDSMYEKLPKKLNI